ncbi:MAG: hypothetical protein GXP23_10425 [Gammaproteobacteria bacterium]|nr:hypothetical protein [Gammaproteobacteria bacterium]
MASPIACERIAIRVSSDPINAARFTRTEILARNKQRHPKAKTSVDYELTSRPSGQNKYCCTAVPLTPHCHAGLDPVSSKSLKPLDSGLRRNDSTVGFPASQALRQRQQNKIRLTGQ